MTGGLGGRLGQGGSGRGREVLYRRYGAAGRHDVDDRLLTISVRPFVLRSLWNLALRSSIGRSRLPVYLA